MLPERLPMNSGFRVHIPVEMRLTFIPRLRMAPPQPPAPASLQPAAGSRRGGAPSGSAPRVPSKRRVACAAVAESSEGRRTAVSSASQVRQQLSGETAEAVLAQCRELWPGWGAKGCSLLQDDGRPVKDAPAPELAAAALHVVASRLLRMRPDQRPASLGRHPVVMGLAECLRVTPPRLGSSAPPAALAAAAAAAAAGPKLGAAGVSAAIWALAVLGGAALYEAETEALCSSLRGSEYDRLYLVADAAWGLATARHWTPHLSLLEAQAAGIISRELAAAAAGGRAGGLPGGRPPVSSAQFASLVWGLAYLGHAPTALLDLTPELMRLWAAPAPAPAPGQRQPRGGQGVAISPASLCTLAWSLAASGQLGHPAAAAVLAQVAASGGALLAHAGAKQLNQLHQVALAARLENARSWGDLLRRHHPAAQLFAAAEVAWAKHGANPGNTMTSAYQADVAATALGMGLAIEEEARLGGLSVDIAVRSTQLAIEVDGPTHFARNDAGGSGRGGGVTPAEAAAAEQPGFAAAALLRRPLGATLLKHRLLAAQGWAVAHVDTAAWEALRGPEQKRALLAAAIKEALDAVAPGA